MRKRFSSMVCAVVLFAVCMFNAALVSPAASLTPTHAQSRSNVCARPYPCRWM